MCGQRGHVHKTLAAFLHDLLHGVFHFEGKTWRTLPMLAWRPGELTRRYIAGERARFVSPMALFLFSVFLMFAVFQLVGLSPPSDSATSNIDANGTAIRPAAEQLDGLEQARRELADGNPRGADPRRADRRIERRLANAEREARGEPEVLAQSKDGGSRLTARRKWVGLPRSRDRQVAREPEPDGLQAAGKQLQVLVAAHPAIDPVRMADLRLAAAVRAYDHAVFVTYSLCFMSLLFVTIGALGQVPAMPGWLLVAATFLIPPVHIYKQLKGAYSLSRFSAVWRTMILLVFIVIVLVLFLDLCWCSARSAEVRHSRGLRSHWAAGPPKRLPALGMAEPRTGRAETGPEGCSGRRSCRPRAAA
jgi:hypothetical protein